MRSGSVNPFPRKAVNFNDADIAMLYTRRLSAHRYLTCFVGFPSVPDPLPLKRDWAIEVETSLS